jgi:hypothetical protein
LGIRQNFKRKGAQQKPAKGTEAGYTAECAERGGKIRKVGRGRKGMMLEDESSQIEERFWRFLSAWRAVRDC